MQKVFINTNNKLLTINIGDTEVRGKNVDIQTISEIFNENVYRVQPEMLGQDKIVVDLGANIGIFALQAASIGAAKVYAVEPIPANIKVLEQNALANNYENIITIVPKAISTGRENTMVACGRDSFRQSVKSLESDYSKSLTDYDSDGTVNVEQMTLAELLKDITEVDIMKVDIEWSEYEVFTKASKETLDKIKYLVFEFHGTDPKTFGEMVSNLTQSFMVETLGSFEQGGFLFCRRY